MSAQEDIDDIKNTYILSIENHSRTKLLFIVSTKSDHKIRKSFLYTNKIEYLLFPI